LYDAGNDGGESLRVIKFPGELENAGTFLAHSFVFWALEVAVKAFDERASRRGDVIDVPFVLVRGFFISEGMALGERPEFITGLGLSLSTQVSLQAFILGES